MIFDAIQAKQELVELLRLWFENEGAGCNAIIGISGGKDSSVCAALCVEALGADRVVGVMMPNLKQDDISECEQLVSHLGIKCYNIPVLVPVAGIHTQLEHAGIKVSTQASINLPPRIRMATLYAVSQSLNGRVIDTCNLSEMYVGYFTRYGDGAGDVCPLGRLTVHEVKELGYALGLPANLIEKTPSDGLCDKTDEDNLGFSYKVLDRYIRTGECEDERIKERIDYLHNKNLFKFTLAPSLEIQI